MNQPLTIATKALETTAGLLCRLCGADDATTVLAGEKYKLIHCRSCGVRFLDPQKSHRELSDQFANTYITGQHQLDTTFGLARAPVLSRIAAHIQLRRAGGRILDAGCAGGFFLHRYFPADQWELFGVEPSPYAAERARAAGIKVYCDELAATKLPVDFFDVVTALQVLCYFRDPQRELAAIRAAMKPTGLLVIELALAETQIWRHATPIGRLLGGNSRSLVGGGHLYFYNPKSLRILLAQCGFELLETVPLPGIRQRTAYQDFLIGSYHAGSRALWGLFGGRLMLGPNFMALASPTGTASQNGDAPLVA